MSKITKAIWAVLIATLLIGPTTLNVLADDMVSNISPFSVGNDAFDETPFQQQPYTKMDAGKKGSKAKPDPEEQAATPDPNVPLKDPYSYSDPRAFASTSGTPKPTDEEATPRPGNKVTVFEDEGVSSDPGPEGTVTFVVTIAVPHNKKAVSKVVAYPWPMKPPKKTTEIRKLPEKDREIKNSLLANGYFNRTANEHPYPQGGWRLQYAYARAVKKSGMTVPHTIIEHYQWANKMIKYLKPEVIAINLWEKERARLYQKALDDYTDNQAEMETAAIKRGLAPVIMKRSYFPTKKIGDHYLGHLAAGQWWILATHKVPGLKYYWMLPFEVEKGDHSRVILNEGNAIYIEGGW